MSGTRRDIRAVDHRPVGRFGGAFPAGPPSAEPRPYYSGVTTPERETVTHDVDGRDPVTYILRAEVRALDEEGDPSPRNKITLWECSGCPGTVVYGDRLEDHTGWHMARRRVG